MAISDNALRRLHHQFGNLFEKGFARLQVAMFTEPDIEQIVVY